MRDSKIFGIGLSRTGTTTLHHVLSELGFNSVHGVPELLQEPNWDALENHEAFIDTPIPHYFKECDKFKPVSKFILTTRNRDSWLTSMKWMFNHGRILWNWKEDIHAYNRTFYGTKKFNELLLKKKWKEYHEEVYDYFSGHPDKLLVINIEDGFDVKKICSFLDITYKHIEVKKMNKREYASLKQRLRYYLK